MCKDTSERELVIRTLPSQHGPVRVVLNPDEAVAENDFIAAQCEQSGEVWSKPKQQPVMHVVATCDCLVCRLARAEEKAELLEHAICIAGALIKLTDADVKKLRELVVIDNPYLDQLLRDCLVSEEVAL